MSYLRSGWPTKPNNPLPKSNRWSCVSHLRLFMLALLESIIYSILIRVGSTFFFSFQAIQDFSYISASASLPPFALGFFNITVWLRSQTQQTKKGSAKPEPSKAHLLDSTGKFFRHSRGPRTTISKQEWHRLLFHPLLYFFHNIFFVLHRDICLGCCCDLFYILLVITNPPWLQPLPCCLFSSAVAGNGFVRVTKLAFRLNINTFKGVII